MILVPVAGAAAAKPCSSSNLVIWAGPKAGGGTAGGFEYTIAFTNLGSKACTLKGIPSVVGVDLHGKKIGAPAGRGAARRRR